MSQQQNVTHENLFRQCTVHIIVHDAFRNSLRRLIIVCYTFSSCAFVNAKILGSAFRLLCRYKKNNNNYLLATNNLTIIIIKFAFYIQVMYIILTSIRGAKFPWCSTMWLNVIRARSAMASFIAHTVKTGSNAPSANAVKNKIIKSICN